MKPFSEMTDQELNEWIAVKRGYENINEVLINKEWVKGNFWSKQCVAYFETHAPDFCSDWRYAGELLNELCENNKYVEIEHITYLREGYRIHGSDSECCATVTRAIAEAWSEMSDNDQR